MIDLFNADFIASNPPLRIFQKADRVVIGNLLAEKGGNCCSEMTSNQSFQAAFQSSEAFWGRAEIDDRISSPFKDFIMIETTKREQQVAVLVTIRESGGSLLAL